MVEDEFHGDYARMFFLSFAFIVCYLYGDLIEDLVYRDMGRLGGLWHNWSYVWAPFVHISTSYALMHLYYGHKEHGAWRHPDKPIYDSVVDQGKLPMNWPVTKYDESEDKLYWVVAFAVLSYGMITLYYQILTKRSIRLTKSELRDSNMRRYGQKLKNN